MTEIRVLFFARIRDLAGTDYVMLALPADATVSDVRRELAKRMPALTDLLPRCAIGVNGEYAADVMLISQKAEVAILPPVSGG